MVNYTDRVLSGFRLKSKKLVLASSLQLRKIHKGAIGKCKRVDVITGNLWASVYIRPTDRQLAWMVLSSS